jgi:hypothetical protein
MLGTGLRDNISTVPADVRFSNRPFGVKHFQTIHHCGVECRPRVRASLRNRHQGPSIMGFEDEAAQSLPRHCHQTKGRSKRTYELTSSIVSRGGLTVTSERPASWRMPSPKQMEKLAREAACRRDTDRPDDPAPCDSLPNELWDALNWQLARRLFTNQRWGGWWGG